MKNKLRFLTTKQARRRGVAMEMALVVLMVTFALSSLIVSIAMVEADKAAHSADTLLQRTELEQLGQDFCAAVVNGSDLTDWAAGVFRATKYQYRASVTGTAGESTLGLTVYPANEGDTVLLRVALQQQGEHYTVTQWAYRE